MIFSRFLTPDHAKPDPNIRIHAISKLNPSEPKSKQILHELAFNDESEEVNLRALEKLNSFALWQKTAQTAKNQRVKKHAVKRVHHAVLSETELSETERKQFVIESADSDLVNSLIEQGGALFQDVDFVLKVLQKTSKPSVINSVFLKHGTSELRKRLIEQQSDVSVLQKWHKKVDDEHIRVVLEERISTLDRLKARPQELLDELRVLLAKLLALSESSDYLAFAEARQYLNTRYSTLSPEFDLLKERDQHEIKEKKLAIDGKLDYQHTVLFSIYQENQEKEKRSEAVIAFEKRIADSNTAVEALFSKIDSATLAELGQTQSAIQRLAEEIESSASLVGRGFSEPANLKLNELSRKLTRIPQWQQQTQKVLTVLSTLNLQKDSLLQSPQSIPLALPDMEKDFFSEYDNTSPIANVHIKQWQTIKSELLAAQAAYQTDLKKRVQQLRKPLNTIAFLIEQGKYRAAMSKFSEFKVRWDEEDVHVKADVNYKYDDVLAQIERLEGWQHYLAAPRKPQLVEEARALIDDDTLSMVDRAEKIKLLRKQWQSLSLPDKSSSESIEQNKEFDQLLELAFAPCRAFFAEQEVQKKSAIADRQSIITALKAVYQNDTIQAVDLLKESDSLVKQWHTLSSVPRSDYQALKSQFDAIRRDIQQKLSPYFQNNKLEKQSIIKRITKLADQESNKDITEQAKQLQQHWKTIGSAGERADRKLWKSFRESNDVLFAKAKQDKAKRKAELDNEIKEIEQQVEALLLQCCDMDDEAFATELLTLNETSKTLPKAPQGRLANSLKQAEHRRYAFFAQRENEKQQQELNALSDVLHGLIEEPSTDILTLSVFSQLPKPWQLALNDSFASPHGLLHDVVLLETLLDLPSPEPDKALKTHIQMQRLNESFNNNAALDVNKQVRVVLSVFRHSPDATLLKRILNGVKAAHLNEAIE